MKQYIKDIFGTISLFIYLFNGEFDRAYKYSIAENLLKLKCCWSVTRKWTKYCKDNNINSNI